MPGEGDGCLLADVPDAQGVDEARQVVVPAPADLGGYVETDLAELARTRALGPPVARVPPTT